MASNVDVATIGQYLQPTRRNLPVAEYVTPEQFDAYRDYRLSLGFKMVFSGPFVRSSYMADRSAKKPSRQMPDAADVVAVCIAGLSCTRFSLCSQPPAAADFPEVRSALSRAGRADSAADRSGAHHNGWQRLFMAGRPVSVFWFFLCTWIQFVLEVHGGMGRWGGWGSFFFLHFEGPASGGIRLAGGPLMRRAYAVPAVAALWTGLERTHGTFGFAWLALGNAGIDMSVPLRLAPIVGVYGLSFVFACSPPRSLASFCAIPEFASCLCSSAAVAVASSRRSPASSGYARAR